MKLRRHDLLDVAPEAWAEVVAGLDLPADAARVTDDWCRSGRPVIVRRRLVGDLPGMVPVALQLPNACGRLRLALAVPETSVTRRASIPLAAAASVAPARWRATIASLLQLGNLFGAPTVYGGLMWQYLTGEPVLRATSDLDLLWRSNAADRCSLLTALKCLESEDVRIDGEIELEKGAASWRELCSMMDGAVQTVFVKTIDGIELRDDAADLRSELAPC